MRPEHVSASSGRPAVGHRAMPDDFRGKLTERQVHYLVAGANSIRKLVRIKIADDNDLEQAKEALKTAIDCC